MGVPRRLLLGLGALGLGGGLIASACRQRGDHLTDVQVSPVPTPSRFVEEPDFDLMAYGRTVLDSARLSEGTIMQSFGFAARRGTAYAIQLIGGGLQLQGELAPVPAVTRARAGDLVINRLDRDGTVTGRMYLLGYGHGVQIGIEERGGTDFIWCEAASRDDGINGWGTELARLPFTDLAVVPANWPKGRIFKMQPDADRVAVSVDIVHSYVVVRVRRGADTRFLRIPMADMLAGRMEPSDVIVSPEIRHWFQGFASHGPFLYLLEGVSETAPLENPLGSTHINVVSWRTGEVVERQLITDGLGLENREAEGLAVRLRDPDDPSTAELCIGFGSGPIGDRRASVFAKPQRS